jgi:putative tryptophan/tyrosine transport system substrate-binding protein
VIGFLNSGASTDGYFATLTNAFRKGLTTTGYVEGQNVTMDFRWAEGQYNRLPVLADQLVQRQVTLISAGGPPAARAAKAATATIPIVFTVGDDPVKSGLVTSFNRPGGNATGVSLVSNEAEGKRLGLLRELVPRGAMIAIILNAKSPAFETQSKDVQAAARAVDQKIHIVNASNESEIDTAFATVLQERAGGLLVGSDPFFTIVRERFTAFALHHAIPAAYDNTFDATSGLLSYGLDTASAYRQAGIYVGRILKGERPSDLPVVRMDKFKFVINLKTAKALGLTIPPGVLAMADGVVE